MSETPRVYVFCNSCAPEWHVMLAIADDGHCLASHVCSAHGWANHDMGIDEGGWNRERYAEHYPDGFVVEWVENPRTHAGLQAAYTLNQKLAAKVTNSPTPPAEGVGKT